MRKGVTVRKGEQKGKPLIEINWTATASVILDAILQTV